MNANRKKIWILEDDHNSRFVYNEILSKEYSVNFFDDLKSFEDRLNTNEDPPDLFVADLRLPDGNFIQFLTQSKHDWLFLHPLVIISSVDDVDILRTCFDHGVHDFMTKPFSKNELVIKIERMLKNPKKMPLSTFSTSNDENEIEIDYLQMCLRKSDKTTVHLTVRELQIFSVLHKHMNHVVKKKVLFEETWKGTRVSAKTLDVHLFNLRKKIICLGLSIRFEPPDGFMLSNSASTAIK